MGAARAQSQRIRMQAIPCNHYTRPGTYAPVTLRQLSNYQIDTVRQLSNCLNDRCCADEIGIGPSPPPV